MAENVCTYRMLASDDMERFAGRIDRLDILFQTIVRLSLHPESETDCEVIGLAQMGKENAEALSVELRRIGVEILGEEVDRG